MTIAEYINALLSKEEYSFSWEEILENTSKTETAIKRELSRLVSKGKIINLRKGFYLIITPRYEKMGVLPIELYIHKLFEYLKRAYYLSLYSAAKFHGASHQQIQEEYIISSLPSLHDIRNNNISINFFNTSNWPQKNIIQKKADAGLFNISSVALTMSDLIHYHGKLGGLNRMLSVLEELAENLEMDDLKSLLEWYPHKSTIQRLGYLLSELDNDEDKQLVIQDYLRINGFYPVLLSPKKGQRPGKAPNKWKIDINIKLESDL